jgi:hypothetical protein
MPVRQEKIAGNLAAEEVVVKKIHEVSQTQNYVVYAYSTSIYYYEYSYLFKWLYNENVPYRPDLNPADASLIFLIIPPGGNESEVQDFIHYRAPIKTYMSQGKWILADGTEILKEVHRKE